MRTTNNLINRSCSSRLVLPIVVIAASLLATPLVMATYTSISTTQMAYAQELEEEVNDDDDGTTAALTMKKEITNPSGGGEESVINAQSAENSENAAATRESTSSLSVQEGDDDTPALHREMTLKLPNDRILFRVVESADESSSTAAGQNVNSATNVDND